MKNLHIFAFLIMLSSLLLTASASPTNNVTFPVSELGNCSSKEACKAFCDQPDNIKACLDFAEAHNLISKEESQKARIFIELGEGPGSCKTPLTCEAYCNDADHMVECINFAEEHNLILPEELAEAKKIRDALSKGAKLPGNCNNKSECEAYCTDPTHMAECITFAEAAGFIPASELEEAKKMLQAIEKGARPPACRGKTECNIYCTQAEHFEECLIFAEAADLIPPSELEDAKKALQAIKKGINPPACYGTIECDVYCAQPEHFEECIIFAEAAGFISKEDAEMAKKTGGAGPGGCRSKAECDVFCQKPENMEVCFNFAKEHGLISQEQLQQMQEGIKKMQEGLNNAPPEVMNCLIQSLGQETIDKIKAGTVIPSQEMGEKMQACFEAAMPQGYPGPKQGMPPEGPQGAP